MNSTKFVCTHMLAQSACDALFSETVGTEFFCPPCEFFALVFQSQQKFQATITKKLTESHSTHFVCAHMLVQSACDAIFRHKNRANFFLCSCEIFFLLNPYRTDFLKFSQKMLCF